MLTLGHSRRLFTRGYRRAEHRIDPDGLCHWFSSRRKRCAQGTADRPCQRCPRDDAISGWILGREGLRVSNLCDTFKLNVSPASERQLKTLNIRQIRSALSHLDELVAEEGEVVVTRRGRPLARILPARPRRRIPSRSELRASMTRLKVPSEALIRQDRDLR